jgi:signal peptidase II
VRDGQSTDGRGGGALARWLILAALVVALDQASKGWLLTQFSPGEARPVTDFFNLVLVFNRGAAFSFLADAGGWQHGFFILLAVTVSVWIVVMLRRHARERLLPTALALILGGALGNLVDRLRLGAVVDFLDVHLAGYHWPAFNLADSAITLGIALMLIQQFRQPKS